MLTLDVSGLVDYVSETGTPAIDRAVTLADEIAANGAFIIFIRRIWQSWIFFPPVSEAPLALRSAKLAISRALELSLEPGESRPLTSSLSRSRAFIGLDFERAAYEPLLQTKDREEALQAFKDKRKPVFKGE
jgi:methylglutaconyl-CoA hydratase